MSSSLLACLLAVRLHEGTASLWTRERSLFPRSAHRPYHTDPPHLHGGLAEKIRIKGARSIDFGLVDFQSGCGCGGAKRSNSRYGWLSEGGELASTATCHRPIRTFNSIVHLSFISLPAWKRSSTTVRLTLPPSENWGNLAEVPPWIGIQVPKAPLWMPTKAPRFGLDPASHDTVFGPG